MTYHNRFQQLLIDDFLPSFVKLHGPLFIFSNSPQTRKLILDPKNHTVYEIPLDLINRFYISYGSTDNIDFLYKHIPDLYGAIIQSFGSGTRSLAGFKQQTYALFFIVFSLPYQIPFFCIYHKTKNQILMYGRQGSPKISPNSRYNNLFNFEIEQVLRQQRRKTMPNGSVESIQIYPESIVSYPDEVLMFMQSLSENLTNRDVHENIEKELKHIKTQIAILQKERQTASAITQQRIKSNTKDIEKFIKTLHEPIHDSLYSLGSSLSDLQTKLKDLEDYTGRIKILVDEHIRQSKQKKEGIELRQHVLKELKKSKGAIKLLQEKIKNINKPTNASKIYRIDQKGQFIP